MVLVADGAVVRVLVCPLPVLASVVLRRGHVHRMLAEPDPFGIVLERIDVRHPAENERDPVPAGVSADGFGVDRAAEPEARVRPSQSERGASSGQPQKFTCRCQTAMLSGSRASSCSGPASAAAVYITPTATNPDSVRL